MEKAVTVKEREGTHVCVATRKNKSQHLKFTDKLWIVEEVLNFGKEAAHLKRGKTKTSGLAKGFLISFRRQPPSFKRDKQI